MIFDPAADVRWLRRLGDLAVRLGFMRALLLLSLVLWVAGVALVQALAWWIGTGPQTTAVLAAAATLAVLAPSLSAAWLLLVFQLDAARQRNSGQIIRDELTGVHNRRHFMLLADREWARCRRYNEDAALLLIVGDHFKTLKEREGAACCDAMLRGIAGLVTGALRQPDLPARYGGEALVVYLPNTDPLGALDVAERIRDAVANHKLRWRDNDISTTVSIGVASAGAAHQTVESLVHDARSALQAARQAGQNCVRAAPIQPRPTPIKLPPTASGLRGRQP
ncbi:MAG: GGDEF domain-containing protein [Rubrivivax sp.]